MYSKVLLAYDGTACSELALREAARMAADGAFVEVVTVAEHPTLRYREPKNLALAEQAAVDKGRVILDQATRRLASQGVAEADTLLIDQSGSHEGSVARAILEEARERDADLIIMGTHGRNGFRRFLLGSVAERVVRESNVPVLLVRGDGPSAFECLMSPTEIYGQWPETEAPKP